MKSLLQRVGWVADKALSVVIWLHDSVMLFICLFWLLPLIVLVVVSAFIYDLRPVLRDRMQEVFIPSWGSRLDRRCAHVQFAATSTARRISHWMGRMPAYVGYVLLGVGGLLWLLGII